METFESNRPRPKGSIPNEFYLRPIEALIQVQDPPRNCVILMKAFVLAGGAGTRLSPLTSYVPKGMIPIAGKPFIDYVINYLAGHGLRHIIMLLSDADSQAYRNHLDDGATTGS